MYVHINWSTIVIILLFAGFFFFIFRIIKDNIPLLKSIKRNHKSFLNSIFLSVILWSPMLIAIIPGLWANHHLELAVKSSIYENTFISDVDEKKDEFLVDLEYSVNEVFDAYEEELLNEIDTIGVSTENAKGTYPKKVSDRIRGTYVAQEATLLNKPKSKFGSFNRWKKRKKIGIFNSLSRTLTNQSNKQMKTVVMRMADVVEDELEKNLENIDTSVDSYSDKAKEVVKAEIERHRIITFETIKNSYFTLKVVKAVFDLFLLIAIVKSFLYVLARVLYSKDSGITFSLDFNQIVRKGIITKKERKFSIGAASKETYYITRKVTLSGAAERLKTPQFFRCFFSRLFNKSLIMDKVDMEEIEEQVSIGQDKKQEFLIYELKEGEVCVFHFRDFVGMTKGIKLKTIFNFQLFSFLFGTIRFSSAKGKGKIILKSTGECTVSPHGGTNKPHKSFSILAFQKKTEFSVESSLGIVDMFFSNYSLKKVNPANIIVASVETDRKRKGIFKFFLRFFIPI